MEIPIGRLSVNLNLLDYLVTKGVLRREEDTFSNEMRRGLWENGLDRTSRDKETKKQHRLILSNWILILITSYWIGAKAM